MRPAGIIIGGITAEFISERGFLTDLIGRAVQYFIIFDSPESGLVIPALPQTAMIYQIIRQCPERKVPCIPPGSRKIAFAVNLITGDKNSDLLQIGGASDSPGLFLCDIQCGQKHPRKNRDDRYYDKQLDQCENVQFTFHLPISFI